MLRWEATPNGRYWLLRAGSLAEPLVAVQIEPDRIDPGLEREWFASSAMGAAGPPMPNSTTDVEALKRQTMATVALWFAEAAEGRN